MQIRFARQKLEKTCNSEKELHREFGSQMAKRIKVGLSVLAAVENLAEVPTGGSVRCHQLSHDRDEQFAIDLVHPRRLVFEIDHDPIPRKKDGGIDTKNVTDIVIVEVVDYH